MSTPRRSWQSLCLALALLVPGRALFARPPAAQTATAAIDRDQQIHAWLARGDALTESGAYREAAAEYTRALAALDRVSPAPTPAIVDTLGRLGHAWTLAEHLDAAVAALSRALPLAEGLTPAQPALLATVLERLGVVRLKQDKLKPAREVLERALQIREAASADDPALVATYNAFGDLAYFEGQMSDAETWYRRALTLAERRLPAGHPDIATSLKNVGSALNRHGDLRGAREFRTRALTIAEQALRPDHPELVSYLNDLANSLRFDGEFADARHLYERALVNTERNFGAAHVWTATLVHNIASLSEALGEIERAIRLERRALATWRRELGPRHPNVARALSALGGMLARNGQDRLALSTYVRALSIREEKLTPMHRDVARTLTAAAPILLRLGEDDRARRFLTRAIAIWQLDDKPDRDAANAFAVLGQLQLRHGQLAEAREALDRALLMQERVFGPTHLEVARVRADLGAAQWGLGDAAAALEDALQAEAGPRAQLRMTIRDLAERTALGYASARPPGLDLALSILAESEPREKDDTDAARVFDQLIQSRAVVLDEMAARQRTLTLTNADPALAGLNATLAKARQRYANLTVRGPESPAVEQYRLLITQAREEKEEAERALGEKSARFNAELRQTAATLADVRIALPADAALVAFARYERVPMPSVSASRRRASGRAAAATTTAGAYVAFVLRHDAPGVTAIRLGDAASLDALVAHWRQEVTVGALQDGRSLASAERAYRRVGEALRQRIWDPVSNHLGDARRVFLVPDGTITNISFAALPIGRTAYLVDQEPILHYLSAERDLVRPDNAGPRYGRGLLAIGDPAFGAPAVNSAGSLALNRALTRSACGTLQTIQFSRLPASRTEAATIVDLWTDAVHARGDADAGDAHLLSGAAASERMFKSQAPGQRILHLATHGFFLGDACEPVSNASLRGIGGMAPVKTPVVNVHDKNPLMLSGLALAGANHRLTRRGDDDDGILTAEEVAGLDLSGVEWAVLSACDTGIGEVKNGEGVLGLRRGLHVAGVHTVIMSLWAVEDRATLAWMRALYTGRFSNSLDTATAVRQASRSVLEERRQKQLPTHPFFWAGFVAVGDWH